MEVKRGGFEGPDGWIFELSGGALCLDFVNTLDNRPTEDAKELLRNYSDLVVWAKQVGIVDDRVAVELRRKAARRSTAAQESLVKSRHLRESLFAIFSSVVEKGTVPAEALDVLNAAIPSALSSQKIVLRDGAFELIATDVAADFDRMLPAVIRSAVDLLTSKELSRLRVCASQDCAWLFLDRSRNQSRQWCDMSVCGNRAKAKRFYLRQKQIP